MEKHIYSETTGQLLFTLFDSSAQKRTGKFRLHHHTTTELGYILEGSGNYKIGNKLYDAHSGKAFFIRSNELHCVPTISTERMDFFNLHITPYYLWSVCTDYIEPSILQLIMHKAPIHQEYCGLDKHFDTLSKLFYSEDTKEINAKIRRAVLMLIIEICDHIASNSKNLSESLDNTNNLLNWENIQNAITYIDKHFDEEIKIDDLINMTNLSRSSFFSKFKSYTGMSAMEYIIIRRIETAVFKLRNTNLSVLTIAQDCGFTNLSNFNRIFKKITGTTPSKYRKKH